MKASTRPQALIPHLFHLCIERVTAMDHVNTVDAIGARVCDASGANLYHPTITQNKDASHASIVSPIPQNTSTPPLELHRPHLSCMQASQAVAMSRVLADGIGDRGIYLVSDQHESTCFTNHVTTPQRAITPACHMVCRASRDSMEGLRYMMGHCG